MFLFLGLKVLDLSQNNISHIVDYNFDGLYSLRHLDLSHNVIRLVLDTDT